ncbi:ABC transporter substrate-binding protein [Paraburkholderia tropica]|uniref:ABC transporter substrate-binding protein n=1 Tax=Paraburkholderia tropica TaxID=92647 RepID=UPI003016F3F1
MSLTAGMLVQTTGQGFATERPGDIVRIEFTRFSAFYSPLVGAIAMKYFEDEGIVPQYSLAPPGRSVFESLRGRTVDVVQSAPGLSLVSLEKGTLQDIRHFAQINQKDGFFVVRRTASPDFCWDALEGATMLLNMDTQPLAMFRYACMERGVDFSSIRPIRTSSEDEAIAAFRAGRADYVHLQGPSAQRLVREGTGYIVASVGEVVGMCAFSSLAANRDWIGSDVAGRFARAFSRALQWSVSTDPSLMAASELRYFHAVDRRDLVAAVSAYQKLDTWTVDAEISEAAYNATSNIFQRTGVVKQDHPYEQVVSALPA